MKEPTIVIAAQDYWRHAVSYRNDTFKAYLEEMDFGRRVGVAIEQQFLRIHGHVQHMKEEDVPVTWWGMFKRQHLPTFVRWGILRPARIRTIVTFLRQDFLFPHVTDPEAAAKVAQFFDPSSKPKIRRRKRRMV